MSGWERDSLRGEEREARRWSTGEGAGGAFGALAEERGINHGCLGWASALHEKRE